MSASAHARNVIATAQCDHSCTAGSGVRCMQIWANSVYDKAASKHGHHSCKASLETAAYWGHISGTHGLSEQHSQMPR